MRLDRIVERIGATVGLSPVEVVRRCIADYIGYMIAEERVFGPDCPVIMPELTPTELSDGELVSMMAGFYEHELRRQLPYVAPTPPANMAQIMADNQPSASDWEEIDGGNGDDSIGTSAPDNSEPFLVADGFGNIVQNEPVKNPSPDDADHFNESELD